MQPSLRLDGVAFAYGDDVALLSDVALHLRPGWHGVVGANGAGKTTLLGLIAGELTPLTGTIVADSPAPAIIRCTQRIDALAPEVEAFAYDWDKAACRVRSRLNLDPEAIGRWASLSPGERKRWQIGAALASNPDILLLDEPTNHLDDAARALLVEALARYQGIGVLVSHDRTLLDALCATTIRVADGKAEAYPGGYSQAHALWTAAEDAAQARWVSARNELARARRDLVEARDNRASAEGSLRATARMRDANDNDGRGSLAKGLARKAEATLGRRVATSRSRAERAVAVAEAAHTERPEKRRGSRIFVDWEPAAMQRLVAVTTPLLEVGGKPLLRDVHATVERQDRIHVAGPNGAGKTTLLRAMLADARQRVPPERLLYLPQHLPADDAAAMLDALRDLPPAERGQVLTMCAALGLDPDRLLATTNPSPGEVRKLALAWGLGRRAWLLVLDEPTNDLDLPSIERLEAALADWPGALVLVSHDARFAEAVTETRWSLTSERIRLMDLTP